MKKEIVIWGTFIFASITTILICYGIGFIFTYSSFVFSWTLNMCLMFWYSILVSQIKPRLNSQYFDEKPFEKNGEIYKYFGVHLYRKLLVLMGWEKVIKKDNPVVNDLLKLNICERNTRISELGHILIFFIVFITGLFLSSSIVQAKWFIITNLLLNLYPVIVQRYNRPRYAKLIARKNFNESLFHNAI